MAIPPYAFAAPHLRRDVNFPATWNLATILVKQDDPLRARVKEAAELLKAERLDALFFPGPSSAALAARPGYPTVIVPFAMIPNEPTPSFPDSFDARPQPYGVEFVDLPELQRVYIFDIGGPHTYRTIFMDGRELPKDPDPTWLGYSVGHWEGDALIVNSIGFNDQGWLDVGGNPQTESLRLTEEILPCVPSRAAVRGEEGHQRLPAAWLQGHCNAGNGETPPL
jgi:hypothetical protein